jgi:prepilin-type N-terminal cleavage/methylation domain-containing protein
VLAPPPARAGFTLIEFVGVMAIMAILAASVIGTVVNQMTNAMVTTEATNLSTMNQALVTEILHTYQIPGASNWATSLGSWLLMPSTGVTTNASGFVRGYYYDTNGFGSITLPYTQTNGAPTFPANPRIMMVSSLDGNLPDASGPLSTSEFNAVWNTPANGLPASWTNASSARLTGPRLLIQRINLLPLFKQVILSAVDTNDFGGFTVQSGTNPITACSFVLTNAPSSAWYLLGTSIGLYDTNYNVALQNCNTNLESQYVVVNNISYVFEAHAWRGLLTGWGAYGPAPLFLTPMTVTNTDSITNLILVTTTVATYTTNYINAVAVAQNYTSQCHNFTTCGNNSHNSWHSSDCGESCQSCCDNFMSDYNSWQRQGCGGGCTYNNICNDCKTLCDMCGNLSQ